MSGRGNCDDNVMVLRRKNGPQNCFPILFTFFKTIKPWLIWPVTWQSRQRAENAVARDIDGFSLRRSWTRQEPPQASTRSRQRVHVSEPYRERIEIKRRKPANPASSRRIAADVLLSVPSGRRHPDDLVGSVRIIY